VRGCAEAATMEVMSPPDGSDAAQPGHHWFAGAGDPPDSLAGWCLLASPAIGDGRFARTVVLMVEHDDDGAVGVVLNQPGQLPVDAVLETWAPLACEPAVVFTGGPVAPEHALGLTVLRGGPDPVDATHAIPGPAGDPADDTSPMEVLGVVDLSSDPAVLAGVVGDIRVFAGYAGWGPGQLEDELVHGAWWVARLRSGDALSDDPLGLWPTLVARQPGGRSVFALYPADPDLN